MTERRGRIIVTKPFYLPLADPEGGEIESRGRAVRHPIGFGGTFPCAPLAIRTAGA